MALNKHKKYIGTIMTVVLACSISGCNATGSTAQTETVSLEKIELLEPVSSTHYYDVVQYRDICKFKAYSCVCVPDVTEFAYTTDVPFETYGKLPGETVKTGDVLVYGDTGNKDEEIENLTDELSRKIRDYEDDVTDLQEDIYDARMVEYEASEPYMENISNKPDEGSAFYDMWAKFSMPIEGAYKSAVLSREQIEQALKEKQELFALELTYEQGRLARMAEEVNEASITANKEGTVVATGIYTSGDYISQNTNIIALGDMQTKVLHTEYISSADAAKAADIYAAIDGKRYEVTYRPMEEGEYAEQKKQNGVVYSEFIIHEAGEEVPIGKYATLIVVEEYKENVLAVSEDALRRNGTEYYCYLTDETGNMQQTVSVGVSDGIYTEVISGLSEGDKVLTDQEITAKDEMTELTKGSMEEEYRGYGTLYYPSTKWISNPAKYGTFHISEICVEKNAQVTKGQELAKIEVVPDSVSIERLERKLQRQQERLAKLLEKKSKIYHDEIDRSLDRAIEARQKAIEDYSKDLAKMKEYTGIISLTAPYDGVVTDLAEHEVGDALAYHEGVVQVADKSLCYIVAENKDGKLSYGNEATITYTAEDGAKKEVQGTVVSVYGKALSGQLNTGTAFIRIPESEAGKMTNQFEISATVHQVSNVILLPKNAVTLEGEYAFVKIKDDQGNVSYQPFILGGSDPNYYWAAYGLSEGMKVCLN